MKLPKNPTFMVKASNADNMLIHKNTEMDITLPDGTACLIRVTSRYTKDGWINIKGAIL